MFIESNLYRLMIFIENNLYRIMIIRRITLEGSYFISGIKVIF